VLIREPHTESNGLGADGGERRLIAISISRITKILLVHSIHKPNRILMVKNRG